MFGVVGMVRFSCGCREGSGDVMVDVWCSGDGSLFVWMQIRTDFSVNSRMFKIIDRVWEWFAFYVDAEIDGISVNNWMSKIYDT